jgi:hypothetical protein
VQLKFFTQHSIGRSLLDNNGQTFSYLILFHNAGMAACQWDDMEPASAGLKSNAKIRGVLHFPRCVSICTGCLLATDLDLRSVSLRASAQDALNTSQKARKGLGSRLLYAN